MCIRDSHQAHAPFRIVTIHDRAVFFQQFLDKGGFQDGIRVFFVREVRGVDPAARRALRRGVIVQGEPVHHPARFAHQRFRPIVIGARHARARAAGDLVYARTAVTVSYPHLDVYKRQRPRGGPSLS